MQKTKRMRTQRRGGFTLIEVLLVVAIIALLAAFVVPSFTGVQSGAERKLAQTKVSKNGGVGTAIRLYHMDMHSYPEELSDLVEKPDDEDKAEQWNGPYLEDLDNLKDPWGNELKYKAPGEVNTNSYDLWSVGPDGEDGTDDDIGNWTKDSD
jgi:general secretion pathway protein G